MNCPHCGQTVPSIPCPNCGGEVPERSLFCCWCGKAAEKAENQEQADPFDRVPCSDGTCIGTLNETGVCSICGKPSAAGRG